MASNYWNNTGAVFFIPKKKINSVNKRGLFTGMGPFSICQVVEKVFFSQAGQKHSDARRAKS
jgi:hypothetical protein